MRVYSALFLASAITLAGCSQHTSSPAPTTAAPAVDSGTAASISGVVNFQGAPPQPVKIDMGLDPACNMSAQQNYSEQVVVDQGKLANVFVYVKSGLTAHSYPAPSQPVTITQRGCRYVPHVAVALAGQTIRLVNDDPAMHNIHPSPTASGNREWNISQMPKGVPIERSFATPEVMMPVKCNQHPWMKMYLNIAGSPYFAVTGENGTFVIPGLPPGDYVLAAVHEKYGEQDISVHLGAKQTQDVTFTYQAQ